MTGILWPGRLQKYLPSLLAAATAGCILGLFWSNDLRVIGEVSIGRPEWHLPTLLQALTPEQWGVQRWLAYLVPAMTLALVGSVDSLMNARMADALNTQMADRKNARMADEMNEQKADEATNIRHRPNQELVAQGIGNIAAGLIGALPGSANTAATVANIQSEGKQIAGIFCALLLLMLVLYLGWFVQHIPIAMLAGVLVKVGLDLIIDRKQLLKLRPSGTTKNICC